MRNLTFALCLAVGTTLALHSADAFSAKTHKTSVKRGHKNPARGKPHVFQNKKIYRPADVWARLRTGIGLPKPSPAELPPPPLPPVLDQIPPISPAAASEPPNSQFLTSSNTAAPSPQDLSPSVQTGRIRVAGLTAIDTAGVAAPSALEDATGATAPFESEEERQREYKRRLEEYEQQVRQYEDLKRQEEIYQRFHAQVVWYTQRIGFIQQSVERARPYLYLIIEELERRKLPLDLALLPILESGYKPRAESPKEASGIWQFIPSTGKVYGLKQNDWYDGRLDIGASTRAAVTYLAHLRRRFKGDWLLALAGYNCGEGKVEQAMAANRAAGLPADFWSLTLPEETKSYVPRMLALSAMFTNPGAYKLKLKPIPNQPYLVRVKFEQTMPVEEVSRLASLSAEKFLYLNPGFINGTIGADGSYDLLLPRQNAEEFKRQLELRLHPPEPSAPLFEFAGNMPDVFPSAPKSLQLTASIVNGPLNRLHVELPIATDSASSDAVTQKAAPNAKPVAQHAMMALSERSATDQKERQEDVYHMHGVSVGESVEKVAEYYNVDAELVRNANKLKQRKRLKPGEQLIIPLEQATPVDLLAEETLEKAKKTFAIGATSQPGSEGKAPKSTWDVSCGERC